MAAREGHVSAVWLASNAAAVQRRMQRSSPGDDDINLNPGVWNRSRITWDELNDARQSVASVAHVWDEERVREKMLRRRWPWRLLTMSQAKAAASERMRRKRLSLQVASAQQKPSSVTGSPVIGAKAVSTSEASERVQSDQELASCRTDESPSADSSSCSDNSSLSDSEAEDTRDDSARSGRPIRLRVATRALLGLPPLARPPERPSWCCAAGVRVDPDGPDAGYVECGHNNFASRTSCAICDAARGSGEGGQLQMRTLAVLQTSDIRQVTPDEVASRVEAAAGSDPQGGLHFSTEQVENAMDLQLANIPERMQEAHPGASYAQRGGGDEDAAGSPTPTEEYLAVLTQGPTHGSRRVAAAVLKLQVSFLRLAEYQAAIWSMETAATTGTAHAGQTQFADTEDEVLRGSAADTEAERARQEGVVKAAQLSSNFAVDLIESLVSEAAASKHGRRVSRHLAPKRNFLGLKPAASPFSAAVSLDTETAANASNTAAGPAATPHTAAAGTESAVMCQGTPAPVASRRMLPLQSLEAVYARLPHYPNPEDLPVSSRKGASESAVQPALTSSEASAQLLGSRATSVTVSGQPPRSRAHGPFSSAFEVPNAENPSTLPVAAGQDLPRQRYTAPHGLIFRGRSVYVDAPTTVKGRLRYDRVGKFRPPAMLEVAAVTQRRHESLDMTADLDRVAPDVRAVFGSAAEMGVPPNVLRCVLKQFDELPPDPNLDAAPMLT